MFYFLINFFEDNILESKQLPPDTDGRDRRILVNPSS